MCKPDIEISSTGHAIVIKIGLFPSIVVTRKSMGEPNGEILTVNDAISIGVTSQADRLRRPKIVSFVVGV